MPPPLGRGFPAELAVVLALATTLALACQPASPAVSRGARPPATDSETRVPSVAVTLDAPPPAAAERAAEPELVLDPAGDGDWPMFHAEASRRGVSRAPPLAAPALRWKAKVGIQSWLNSPLVVGSAVIAPSCGMAHDNPDSGDAVIALDLATGREIWRAPLPNDANGAAANKERVFVSSDDGHVRALDLRTGRELWKARGDGKMYSAPLLFQGLVVVGDAGGHLRGYDLDGAPAFDVALRGSIRGGASADATTIYATSQGGDVVALRRDGQSVWRARVEHPAWDGKGPDRVAEIYAAPVLSDDAVIVPYARDTYYRDRPALSAFDKRTGRLKWRARGPGDFGNLRTTPVLLAGAVIWAEPYSGDVAAASIATGRLLYRNTVGACFFPHWAAPAAAADVVYVQRFDGVLHALRASDGGSLWRFYLGDSQRAGTAIPSELERAQGCEWEVPIGNPAYSPVAVAKDGTVLVGTQEGYLYALGEQRP